MISKIKYKLNGTEFAELIEFNNNKKNVQLISESRNLPSIVINDIELQITDLIFNYANNLIDLRFNICKSTI